MSWKESLEWRYATKKFNPDKKLSKDQITDLLTAANLTPTSLGMQLFKVIVVQDQKVKEQLLEASFNQRQVVDASHVLVFVGRTDLNDQDIDGLMQRSIDARGGDMASREGYRTMITRWTESLSPSEFQHWVQKQIYIALGTVMTVAGELKIDSCPMEGFKPDDYNEILKLNDTGYSSAVVLPVGYRSEEDPVKDLPKVRKTLAELSEFI